MENKVVATVEVYENYIGKKVKMYEMPDKSHKYLDKNECEIIDISEYQ
eukprot:CAMPEP_0197830278 /NCGR_PEP_ID=MMETSP1437-20131217/6880_1 /TAXON_ID=49252 ORGANISM="Eucampia antarctica, Strain CCMP1452" /NCGR_SAMPLE_ID=MMETSP1437 /ASSEMBLY_ACC=CAM_ASM_001096 /LENGTH=47 /DNA_ID= /DNA_START= /DNA_END= /DNA_ORIENTATION=